MIKNAISLSNFPSVLKKKRERAQISTMRNERWEIITNTREIQKNLKRILWTVICQQTGQCRRNGQISSNIQSAKTDSRRKREFEQPNL